MFYCLYGTCLCCVQGFCIELVAMFHFWVFPMSTLLYPSRVQQRINNLTDRINKNANITPLSDDLKGGRSGHGRHNRTLPTNTSIKDT